MQRDGSGDIIIGRLTLCMDPAIMESTTRAVLSCKGHEIAQNKKAPQVYGGFQTLTCIARQYQNHNPRPGPVYAGGGYTPINEASDAESRAFSPRLQTETLDQCSFESS